MTTRPALLVLLLLAFSLALSAQQRYSGDRECGVTELHPRLLKYRAGEVPRAEKSLTTQWVPARFIILGDNNGAGYVDPLKLLRSFDLVNQDFAPMNVQFYVHSIDYINRSSWYEHPEFETGREMMRINNVRGVVNNYIVEDPAGNCGYYSSSVDGMAMGKNCLGANDRTWSHELGHFFTLPHTFFGWESVGDIDDIEMDKPAPETLRYRGRDVPTELVDGSNCEDAADGFCDTAPDFLMNRWPCNFSGEYADSLLDADSVRFAVPAANIMSYALDNCVENFTEEQQAAMLADLNNPRLSRALRPNSSGQGAVAANGAELKLMLPENNSVLEVSDRAELVWSPVENADFYILQVNSSLNFNGEVFYTIITSDTTHVIEDRLQPRRRYFWRVRPFNRYQFDSDFGEQTFRFQNGEFATATIDAALNAAISVLPNPVSAGREILMAGKDLGQSGAMNYQLINASGQVLLSREAIPVSGAGFTTRIATDNLAAGVYFLRLQLNGKLVTKRIMVTP